MNRKERLLGLLNYIRENKSDFNRIHARLIGECFEEEIEQADSDSIDSYLNDLHNLKNNEADAYLQASLNQKGRINGYLEKFIAQFEKIINKELVNM